MKRCLSCDGTFVSQEWTCPYCGRVPEREAEFLCFAPELARSSTGFRPEYFRKLATLEDSHFWFRSRNRLIAWAVCRFFPDAETLVEIGCGTGYVLSGLRKALPRLRLAGSEIQVEGLPFAAERIPDAEFWQMDACAIPFRDEFDIVTAFDVIEHIDDDATALQEMVAATRPGGGVIVTVPQHPFLWSQVDTDACHRRRYRADELRRLMEEAGLKVVYRTSFVSLLLPLLLWARWRQRSDISQTAPVDEFSLPPIVNWALERCLGAERILIQLGIRFPLGGSLLLVGRKAAI